MTRRRRIRISKAKEAYRTQLRYVNNILEHNFNHCNDLESDFNQVVTLPVYRGVTYGNRKNDSTSSEEEETTIENSVIKSSRQDVLEPRETLENRNTHRSFGKTSHNIFLDGPSGSLEQDKENYLHLVLEHCEQKQIVPFSNLRNLNACTNLISEELDGSEVYLCQWKDISTVLLITPIEEVFSGIPQKKCKDILPLILIYRALREIKISPVSTFMCLLSCWCVSGKYPSELLKIRQEHQTSVNHSRDEILQTNQTFIIQELYNCGWNIDTFKFKSVAQLLAAFLQITFALATAEAVHEFELRSVHWSSIHIKNTKIDKITYTISSKNYEVFTMGIQAFVTDISLSRVKTNHMCLYVNLQNEEDWPPRIDKIQDDIFRKMQMRLRNKWIQFEPYNNIIWLDYFLGQLITNIVYPRKQNRMHALGMYNLKFLKAKLKTFMSAEKLVQFLVQDL